MLKATNVERLFGWNSKAWMNPFLRALNDFQIPENATILEIGAGSKSAISLFFINGKRNITVTTCPENQVEFVNEFVKNFTNSFDDSVTVDCRFIDHISGHYDLIIMKSVLGGLYRTNRFDSRDPEEALLGLVANNLNPDGLLITLDNGATIFERLIRKFGARKNHWRFFLPSDFKCFTRQYQFGIFSCFSLTTRIGGVGVILENIIYEIDLFILKFVKKYRPSVIVSVYRAKPI